MCNYKYSLSSTLRKNFISNILIRNFIYRNILNCFQYDSVTFIKINILWD